MELNASFSPLTAQQPLQSGNKIVKPTSAMPYSNIRPNIPDLVQFGERTPSTASLVENIWVEQICTPSASLDRQQALTANDIETKFFPDGAPANLRKTISRMVDAGALEVERDALPSHDLRHSPSDRYKLSEATLRKHRLIVD